MLPLIALVHRQTSVMYGTFVTIVDRVSAPDVFEVYQFDPTCPGGTGGLVNASELHVLSVVETYNLMHDFVNEAERLREIHTPEWDEC